MGALTSPTSSRRPRSSELPTPGRPGRRFRPEPESNRRRACTPPRAGTRSRGSPVGRVAEHRFSCRRIRRDACARISETAGPAMMAPMDAKALDWTLLDCGDERRLDRFAERIVDRPAPSAPWPKRAPSSAWAEADLRFDRDTGWSGRREQWTIAIDGVTLELRPTDAGQLGFFPEQLRFWPWLRSALAGRSEPSILSLFAHTGASTLALVRAGARVTHVDSSRPAIAWARRNAELSGLGERPIRWIVDDAVLFAERESR